MDLMHDRHMTGIDCGELAKAGLGAVSEKILLKALDEAVCQSGSHDALAGLCFL